MRTVKFLRDTDAQREGGSGWKAGEVVELRDASARRWVMRAAAEYFVAGKSTKSAAAPAPSLPPPPAAAPSPAASTAADKSAAAPATTSAHGDSGKGSAGRGRKASDES